MRKEIGLVFGSVKYQIYGVIPIFILMKQGISYRHIVKPTLDFLTALVLLVAFAPLMMLIGLTLLVANKGKVLFIQKRIGQDERAFNLIKFRTMRDYQDAEPKSTKAGALLRRFSLDELPQIFNVLMGNMSFVGPRPLLVEYLPYYNVKERRRHEVKPGISGLAQINGRNNASWEVRMNYDIAYVKSISFWVDIGIVFMTFIQLFKWAESDFEELQQETFIQYAERRS